ncbi:MAG: rod shape-determining protein MreC [Chloroflexaceae bacterium]|nr:rod shape-determining protein MreC [Chloroflexaceae bacterium]
MFSLRRWWERHGVPIVVTGLVLGGVWLLRHTQGSAIAEIYYWVSRPFQGEPQGVAIARLTSARVRELEQQLAEVQAQNDKLRQLLGYLEKQPQAIAAPVIGRSADSWWQQVTVGRGEADGVRVGAAVSGIGGLVGRVVQVTPHTSRVLLVSDPASRVGVAVSRSRDMGYIEGQGSLEARLQFFEKVPDVRPGDAIATSPVSRLYPAGLTVGRIKTLNKEKGAAPEAIVELTAPLESLEWVLIYPPRVAKESQNANALP